MREANWRFAFSSVIGTSHLRQQNPECQDFSVCISSQTEDGELLLAIAADGAGSATCSASGASLVARRAKEFFCELMSHGTAVCEISRKDGEECVRACQKAVEQEAYARGIAPREYACTLLIGIIGVESAAFLQIGDGAIVVDGIDCEAFNWIFWPDRGEYANTTVFVTQQEALDHLNFDRVERPISKVALFTDGIQNIALDTRTHTAFSPFFIPLFSKLAQAPVGRAECFEAELGAFLGSERVNNKTDDDKTLVLAWRP